MNETYTETELSSSGYSKESLVSVFGPPDSDADGVRSWSKSRIQETELRLLLFATPAYAQMVNSDENHEVALLEVQKGSLSLKEWTLDQIRDLMSR